MLHVLSAGFLDEAVFGQPAGHGQVQGEQFLRLIRETGNYVTLEAI